MKAPEFWYTVPGKASLQSILLRPLSLLYQNATARRVAKPVEYFADCPVICVGNLNAGGTGKTPTVIALAQEACSLGAKPVILSRGYGGTLQGPVQVDASRHSAQEVGDEPLLLSAFASTIVCKLRVEGMKAAEELKPDLIILDDGFQDPSVQKTKSLVVVDAEKGFGNGFCIPAGPLREPVKTGLARADAVMSLGTNHAQTEFAKLWKNDIPCPHITAELAPLTTGMDWTEGNFVAFAGIGHPEKFFKTLEHLGATLIHKEALSDHATLSSALLKRLKYMAEENAAQLVTTEKDAVRLPQSFRAEVLSLPVRLRVDDALFLRQFVKDALKTADL